MAPHHRDWPVVALAILLAAGVAPRASAGVSLAALPSSFVVNALVNGLNITNTTTMEYLKDNLTVHWRLNLSYVGKDLDYKQVFIQLCYGAPSTKGRGWRAANADLSKSKQCLSTSIAAQPYRTSGNMSMNLTELQGNGLVPENSTVWQAGRSIPGALYFVRVFALNSTSPSATPANNAVATGQNTNANTTTNLVQVVPYMGTTVTLDITIVVLSVTSYVFLVGFFIVERHMKKNK